MPLFQFKQFTIHQEHCAQKVSEVACIQGAWTTLPISCKRVLDIGSGTGLLTLMLAQRFDVEIDAIEIDGATFKQGKDNIGASPFKDRIHPLHGDLKSFDFKNHYDFIITNPPFFEKQLKAETEKENIARHSSQLTLHELIGTIHDLLTDAGTFSILFPFDRMKELEKISELYHLYPSNHLILKHSVSHLPKVFIGIFSRTKKKIISDEMLIKENGIYTKEMKELIADYYL